jgi:hypothetical protein
MRRACFLDLLGIKFLTNKEEQKMTPYVNTSKKMPKRLFDALTLHEFSCGAKNIQFVTEDSVKEFLKQRFGEKLSEKFKPEYLIKAPAS